VVVDGGGNRTQVMKGAVDFTIATTSPDTSLGEG